jgi:hypothetical protein
VKVAAPPATTYHVVTAVWGSEFIDLFLDVCIPNQLSARNLPALPAGSRYRVFTKSADVPRLSASTRLAEVGRVLPVDIVEVDPDAGEAGKPGQIRNRYKMMTDCHRRAVAEAANADAALIFLAPDFVLAEGTIETLVRLHAAGSRAVLSANLRLARHQFVAAIAGGAAALPPRDLVAAAMRHLHPATESLMADAASANDFPTSVNWPVRSATGTLDGILVRSLHMHPLLLDPVRRHELPRATIDGHYLMRCGLKLKECHLVEDSDELVAFELTPSERNIRNDGRRGGISLSRLAAVASNCDRFQMSHWHHPVRLHATDLDQRWRAVEAASEQLVRDLEGYLPYGAVFFAVYRWLRIARQRRERYARAVRHAVPRLRSKQIVRPARLLGHRASKALRLQLKRMRRNPVIKFLPSRHRS